MTDSKRPHDTGIQWTHVPGYRGSVWNPTTGCTRVSPGCDNCYAFALHDQRHVANREAAYGVVSRYGADVRLKPAGARKEGAALPFTQQYDLPFSTVQMLDDDRLTAPMRARNPRAYFVDSMADLFHEDVPDAFIDRVFMVMACSPQHIFMVLTKRPARMAAYVQGLGARFTDALAEFYVNDMANPAAIKPLTQHMARAASNWPLHNVWLGTSTEDQARANERIPHLLDTPAAVRFISYEPALGPVDVTNYMPRTVRGYSVLRGIEQDMDADVEGLDWVIVGGESGPRARPFDVDWAEDMAAQCDAFGVSVFVKQMGSKPYVDLLGGGGDGWRLGAHMGVGDRYRVTLRHGHGGDPDEWAPEVRRREFPAGHAALL